MFNIKFRYIVYFAFATILVHLSIVYFWANIYVSTLLDSNDFQLDSKLSPEKRLILLTIEDPTFDDHSGLDISNGQGLTTITSSIAREIFLNGKSLSGAGGILQSFYIGIFKCCKRIDIGRDLMALVLDNNLSKKDQLSLYLTTVYMGSQDGLHIWGFKSAALHYYKKSLSELSLDEFTGLVAMPLSPNYYNPIKYPDIHTERVKRIKNLLSKLCSPNGWLDLTYENCASHIDE